MPKWGDSVSEHTIEQVVSEALKSGTIGPEGRAFAFHDLALLRSRLSILKQTFPANTLHAIAIKANPLVRLLADVVEAQCGLEAASMEEVCIAEAARCAAEKIVFDSPVKTIPELHESFDKGYVVNVDNFVELARIDEILRHGDNYGDIGLRVNPMVGAGNIAITSVGDGASKFGVRIDTEKAQILKAFDDYPWLRGLHIHIGSQGCDLQMLVAGAARIAELMLEIRARHGEERIKFVDLGGGLPVAYTDADRPPSLEEYVEALERAVPELFSGPHYLITEFGRAVQSGCGFALAKVEYVKPYGDHQLAAIHLGADMFMRPVYLPAQWKHRYLVLDQYGKIKPGTEERYTIGGPLCFAGDVLCKDEAFPLIEPEDYVVIRDTGAYTISMWNRHCSRGIPAVKGFEVNDNSISFTSLFTGESAKDIADFWAS